MKRLTKAVVALLVAAGVVAVSVPVVPGPSTNCVGDLLCIPDQRLSMTRFAFGFGGESSYGVWPNSGFYYFCYPGCHQLFGP